MSPNRQQLKTAAGPLAAAGLWSALLVLFAFTSTVLAQSQLTLAWDPSPDPSVVGYRFYSGCASRAYTNSVDVGNSTICTVTGLKTGVTYYFAVTAYNQNRVESDFSTEVVYTVGQNASPVRILSWGKQLNGSFSLSGTGAAGQTCVLMAATNAAGPVWSPVATNTADAQGAFNCTDTQAGRFSRRFYRIQAR